MNACIAKVQEIKNGLLNLTDLNDQTCRDAERYCNITKNLRQLLSRCSGINLSIPRTNYFFYALILLGLYRNQSNFDLWAAVEALHKFTNCTLHFDNSRNNILPAPKLFPTFYAI